MNSAESAVSEHVRGRRSDVRSVLPAAIALGVIAFGGVVRLAHYAANRSLWFDELLLALNVVERPWWRLLTPLDDHQGAPAGFLLTVKAVTAVLGNGEMALRLVPLLAGLASLLLFAWVARRTVSVTFATVALALFALGEYSIYYATEAKQYAVDLFVVLVIYVAVLRLLECPERQRHYWVLGGVGAAAIWFSHPALFVLAGTGAMLVLDTLFARKRERFLLLVICFVPWAVSFAAAYVMTLRHLAADEALVSYWQAYFMPLPPWREWGWFATAFERLAVNPVGSLLPWTFLAALVIFGVASLYLQNWRWATVLTVPLLLTLLASALQQYPFGQRLMLFAVPALLLLIAAGADRIGLLLMRWPMLRYGVLVLLAGILLTGTVVRASAVVQAPPMVEHVRPVLMELKRSWQPEDYLYVYYGATPALEYYTPLLMLPEDNRIIGGNHRENPALYLSELDQLRGKARVWILFSHIYDWSTIDERAHLLQYLDTLGVQQDELRDSGASLHLYNLAREDAGRQQ